MKPSKRLNETAKRLTIFSANIFGLPFVNSSERPSSPIKGHSPQFSAHVCCGQTAGWIKIPLDTEEDLDPDHIVLRGPSSPRPKGAQQPPLFGPCLLWPNSRPSQPLMGTCYILAACTGVSVATMDLTITRTSFGTAVAL